MNIVGSNGLLDLKLRKAVAAAAFVPSSLTSILALCKASPNDSLLVVIVEKLAESWNKLPTPSLSNTYKINCNIKIKSYIFYATKSWKNILDYKITVFINN